MLSLHYFQFVTFPYNTFAYDRFSDAVVVIDDERRASVFVYHRRRSSFSDAAKQRNRSSKHHATARSTFLCAKRFTHISSTQSSLCEKARTIPPRIPFTV